MTPPTWTLRLSDFRGLAQVEWSPEGVCLLGGPNGAGKTTMLEALKFLRSLYLRGLDEALRFLGASYLRRRGADPDAVVGLSLEVGELRWDLELPIAGLGVQAYPGERLERAGKAVLDLRAGDNTWSLMGEKRTREDLCGLRVFWDRSEPAWLRPMVDLLRSFRVYDVYRLDLLRQPVELAQTDQYLHPTGRNLWQVLRVWQGAPRRYRDQFAWVLEATKRAFPGLIEDLEFPEGVGGAFQAVFYPADSSGPDDHLPVHLAADGLLTGLLHLTAVAGAQDGSVLAFDELENQLHPHAIRVILAAMRELAEARNLTIILTTHSPVVMNAFKGQEDRFYVLDRGLDRSQPVPLDEARDPDWLAHFALGDLYEREKIAPQRADKGR